jgi:threonyl-tRNA synthetase
MSNIEQKRHSLSHVLAMAVLERFPKVKFGIGPTIENGFYYDFGDIKISDDDLAGLEKKMRLLIAKDLKFEKKFITTAETKKIFKNQKYKLELIKELQKEKQPISIYQSGDFIDLCAGPHIKSTKEINPEIFKLTKIAGAYWKGSEKNPMLTRIYGLAFETKKELDDYLKMAEEAEKRDHRKLGKELEIYTTADEIGPGLILWLPNGVIIKQELEKWAIETEKKWGYKHVSTPHITKAELFKISGHLPYYKEDLYAPFEIEGEAYYLKPMNCPHTHMIYKSKERSYRDLPLRLAEYGQVYRYERSGVLHGLMRVRGFCQNDAHIYVQPENAVEEFINVLNLHKYYYNALKVKDWRVMLGVRDPKNLRAKYHGDDKMWQKAEEMTKEALDKADVEYEIEKGGAAHYGPKADIYIRSAIGKEYAIGTDQLDLYMPERFKLSYTDKDGKEKMPYVIHRAPLGSHERMVGFLLEHYAGNFPVWLSPVQVKILPVSEKFNDYAKKVLEELQRVEVRSEIDENNETLGKRIRNAELQKIPYVLVVGEKEKESGTVSVRERGKGDLGAMPLEKFIEKIKKEISEKK